jgi:hypothetical protein
MDFQVWILKGGNLGVSWCWLRGCFMLLSTSLPSLCICPSQISRIKTHKMPPKTDKKHSLWAIKYSTTLFLRSLTESVSLGNHRKLLHYLHIFLGLTFIATIIADLGACHPFSHYWQVVPDPGPACRSGAAHLYTLGVLNIITNLALVVFPVPMILRSKIEGRQ